MAKKSETRSCLFNDVKVWNSLTARSRGDIVGRHEATVGPSLTLPDQAYSVRELFARSGTGMTLSQRTPVYSDDDVPPLERMDFAERRSYLDSLTVRLRQEKRRLDEEGEKLKVKEAEAHALRVKEEREALLKELREQMSQEGGEV